MNEIVILNILYIFVTNTTVYYKNAKLTDILNTYRLESEIMIQYFTRNKNLNLAFNIYINVKLEIKIAI